MATEAQAADPAAAAAESKLGSHELLKSWLNRSMRVKITDGRILIGTFLCTDKDANLILGSAQEYLDLNSDDPRTIGLAMIPGRHIISVEVDEPAIM